MAITHDSDIRNEVAELVAGKVDAGSANLTGQLVFMTSGDAEVATLPFNDPAFVTPAVSGVVVLDTDPAVEDTNTTGGTITKFEIQDKDEGMVLTGTANTTDGDIILTSDVIGAGETLSVVSLSYEAMP